MTFIKLDPVDYHPPETPPEKGVIAEAKVVEHSAYGGAIYVRADRIVAIRGLVEVVNTYEARRLQGDAAVSDSSPYLDPA